MSALRIWFRAEFRRRWRGWVALSLLVGLTGGVVIGAVAGAERTDTAYDRFLQEMNPYDVVVQAVPFPIDEGAIRALPEVLDVSNTPYVFLGPPPGEERPELAPLVVPNSRTVTYDRTKLLEGRRANPDRVDEATVNAVAARVSGIGVLPGVLGGGGAGHPRGGAATAGRS